MISRLSRKRKVNPLVANYVISHTGPSKFEARQPLAWTPPGVGVLGTQPETDSSGVARVASFPAGDVPLRRGTPGSRAERSPAGSKGGILNRAPPEVNVFGCGILSLLQVKRLTRGNIPLLDNDGFLNISISSGIPPQGYLADFIAVQESFSISIFRSSAKTARATTSAQPDVCITSEGFIRVFLRLTIQLASLNLVPNEWGVRVNAHEKELSPENHAD
ncbi:hypothetical protein M231_03683 [Tremella mesenterica]|uniref:Uncharacterized protein n=1 Tax=Tremella mesenterica TaxID=5217 RepID=A0A4Q1BMJ2_TREME|nr:hypothetical protein M231_03683 [Tremella mesenterica]